MSADSVTKYAENPAAYLRELMGKQAAYENTQALGLQLRENIIHSQARQGGSMSHGFSSPEEASKLAATADALEQLSSLVGELRSAHQNSVKVAAALAGAVKLAQDGAIDVEDVFDIAREAILQGRVKQAAVDDLFREDPGELVGSDQSVKHASRAAPAGSSDPLTATLRELRTY